MWALAALAVLGLATATRSPVADIDRDFDRASVQLRLARSQAERLSGRDDAKTPLDPKSAAQSLRTEVHSLRKEFDDADTALSAKDLSSDQLQHQLSHAFGVARSDAPEPREPRRKSDMKVPANLTASDRWYLAEQGRKHPYFKVQQTTPRCDKSKAVAQKVKAAREGPIAPVTQRKAPQHQSRSLRKSLIQLDNVIPGSGRRRVAQGGASMAIPGAGGNQKLADEGRSLPGHVGFQEPMKTVYKDGFSEVGCYTDAMPISADKFGDNKDQYKGQLDDVSVVWYKQHILKENQQPMYPTRCYEFCRTVPHMVYFGIVNGGDCYCTPFYKPSAGATGNCDQPCPGNPTDMCGGHGKSSIFEMHYCNNAAQELVDGATGAGEVLLYFEREAWALNNAANHLNDAGAKLQKVAGQGGDPISGDMAQLAKKTAGELENELKDGTCFQAFNQLQGVYDSAKTTKDLDLAVADNLNKAEYEIYDFVTLSKTVYDCAKRAEARNQIANPWHSTIQGLGGDFGSFWSEHLNDAALYSQMYVPLQYGMNPTTTLTDEDVTMSTCSGEVIGEPMSLWFGECAAACEMTVFPEKCIGFQSYASADFPPLCVMFKEFSAVSEHKCPEAKWDYSMLQAASADEQKPGDVNCNDVKVAVSYSGNSCDSAFGSSSNAKKECGDVCGQVKGFTVAAGCFASLAEITKGGMPTVKTRRNDRCFGGTSNSKGDAVSGPAGDMPVADMSGGIKFGSETAKTSTIWTEKGKLRRR